MNADVVLLPRHLAAEHRRARTVIVLDVLRASTSITAALAAGVNQIRIFEDTESARRAAAGYGGARVLCGEVHCLPPSGFDLGNSPGAFTSAHRGKMVFMSTTNGTRAVAAAQGATRILIGALVNASAVAREAMRDGADITLLCAGTNGEIAMEDLLGAGAILQALGGAIELASDTARIALRLFEAQRSDLLSALCDAQGGRNVIAAGLESDIEFCAAVDSLTKVGEALADPLRVVPAGLSVDGSGRTR